MEKQTKYTDRLLSQVVAGKCKSRKLSLREASIKYMKSYKY